MLLLLICEVYSDILILSRSCISHVTLPLLSGFAGEVANTCGRVGYFIEGENGYMCAPERLGNRTLSP